MAISKVVGYYSVLFAKLFAFYVAHSELAIAGHADFAVDKVIDFVAANIQQDIVN